MYLAFDSLFAYGLPPSTVLFINPWMARGSSSAIGHFLTMQLIFIHLAFPRPKYAASVFAGNSVWRPGIAGGRVVVARPLFINLGVDKGVSLLGGLSVEGIFGTTAISVFGKQL